MWGVIKELGVAGGIGFLVGLGLVSWVQPTTEGGTGILMLIPTLMGMIVGGIVSALRGRNASGS